VSTLQPIEHYDQAATLRREHFLAKYAHPFLVQAIGTVQTIDPDRRDDLTTDRLIVEGPRRALHEAMLVAEIRARDPGQDLVTIGVAQSCDVMLDDLSVSKRHAWFEELDGAWRIWDADSSAGTQVNNDPVQPGYPRPLASGDRITLGYVEMMFFASDGFYDLIHSLFANQAGARSSR